MSLFFAVGQASQALDQSMKAYAQAVSDRILGLLNKYTKHL